MDLKVIFEATVKMPSSKIIDKIINFLLYSYAKRNKIKADGLKKPYKMAQEEDSDSIAMIIDQEDLPYDFGGTVPLVITAFYGEPTAEAWHETDDNGINSIDFHLEHPFYKKAKSTEDLGRKLRTNLRHELTHMLQNYLIVGKGDVAISKARLMPKDYTDSKWKYLTSPIEFEPYIITKIDEFVDKNKKGFKTKAELNKAIVNFINKDEFFKAYKKAVDKKMMTRFGKITADDDEEDQVWAVDYPKLRKKAIKKFYIAPEINELLK